MSHLGDAAPAAVRLMLVDDHALVRDGLRVHLQAEPGFVVVAEAADGESALAAAVAQRPDVVLMDIGLRGANGIEVTRALRALPQPPRVLMLSMHAHAEYGRAALAAGASGYLLKDGSAQEIVDAIRSVMAGGQPLAPDMALALATPAPTTQQPSHPALTQREREVLALVAEGLSSRAIGERLGMGVRTVETHRTNLRRKLNLASPAALVRYAVQRRDRPDD
jgi:two-component system, NarL family, nitrate/nitrite response regulator NarL